MVERSLRARARALHVREHGWWRATHVADYGWIRAHEEASRNVDNATERIADIKDKISPIVEERDTLRKETCLIKERLAKHQTGANSLRKLLQQSVNMLQARAAKLEKGRSHVREMENETKLLEERNNKELATIKEEINMLSIKSADLEKEWIETHETNEKQHKDQLCELQCVNEECAKTCHELVKLDSENGQIRGNIQKNRNRSHKCRPDLARDIKMLRQLQQELEEILTDSRDDGDKHENENQTKMLPRQPDSSIDFSTFLECLTRTLESSLNKSIVDKGDLIPCDLLKSVVDNVEISEENRSSLKTFLKCLIAKDLYGSIDTCLEENGVEYKSNSESDNKPKSPSCEECPSENQSKYNKNVNKYATTNQPNNETVMQINNTFCIANKCPAENLTQNGDKFSTCCLNMETIYVIPLKEYEKDAYSKQENLKTCGENERNTEEQKVKDFKNGKISFTEIPLGCIEYEVTCSNCRIDRSISIRNSNGEIKNNSLGDNQSERLLNQILEQKCGDKSGTHQPRIQNLQSAEPNLKELYVLPTCSENFENLGTPTPISSIDLSPVHIDQRHATCPYCLRQSKSKKMSGNLCSDSNYATDFVNMVVLSERCKNNHGHKVISKFRSEKSSKGISKDLIVECVQGQPCLQCNEKTSLNSANISECDDINNEINTVDMNTQCEKYLPEKQSGKTCIERCLDQILQEINLPKFLDNLLLTISHRNEASCLCDADSINADKFREMETNTEPNIVEGKTNLCCCDAKECMSELKLTKLDDCQSLETKPKQSNVSCLCDKPVKVCKCKSTDINKCKCQEIVKLTTKLPTVLHKQDVTCLCTKESKVCTSGLESSKIENCKCQKNVKKPSNNIMNHQPPTPDVSCFCNKPLDVCMCKYESAKIDDCKCREVVKKIPNNLQTQEVSCLCDKPLDVCMCKYESAEIDNCKCQEIVKKTSNDSQKKLQTQDVSCLCDKPVKVCTCKVEPTEIDDCKCHEIVNKSSSQIPKNEQSKEVLCRCDKPLNECTCDKPLEIDECECREIETKLLSDTCGANCTENTKQSSNITCLCEKPLKQCTCDEITLHPILANLNGDITAKTLSNLCVCDKCHNIHLNLLKKLVKCASECQDDLCFADEILKEIASFPKICGNCGNRSQDCDCVANAFDVDENIGTPKQVRSRTTNTLTNENIETCTSYCLPMEKQNRESNLKILSSMSGLDTGATCTTPQNSASKLVLHSKISDLGLKSVSKIKTCNSVSFRSPEKSNELQDTDSDIISCECFEDKHQKDIITSINICNSNQKIQVVGTSEKLTSTSKNSCRYEEKSHQVPSNTSNTCYNNNLTNNEIIQLFLEGTNLRPEDLRKALVERLSCLKNSSECIDETQMKKDSCIRVEPSPKNQCGKDIRNFIDQQCSPYKKDATNSISEMKFPCRTQNESTSQQNNCLPFPIEFPSCEILKTDHASSKNPSVTPKKPIPNKVSGPEQPQNIKNKPVSPKKRSSTKIPSSEPANLKNISTHPKQRSPGISPAHEKTTPINKPANPKKYSTNKCPVIDTKPKSTKRYPIHKSETTFRKQQKSKSNLSCECEEETLNFTDYTQGDKVSIGCSARNSQLKSYPTKRNTINSQVPSNLYPSTPYSSITTCYNYIDEVPTRLSNYDSNIDTIRSKTCSNKSKTSSTNNMSQMISTEMYCSRSTSCTISSNPTKNNDRPKFDAMILTENDSLPDKKDFSHTIICECSKDAKCKPTPTYCKKSTCDAMTDTNKLGHDYDEQSNKEPCKCKDKNASNQRNIEQNKIPEQKCNKSTCLSFSNNLNLENNNSFDEQNVCNCLKHVRCTCVGRREISPDNITQKTTKLTCQTGTSMSNVTCRKRKKSMYNQSEETQQNDLNHSEVENLDEINKSRLECKRPKDETCICSNRQKTLKKNVEAPMLKCSKSTCVSLCKSNLVSDLSYIDDKTTDDVGLMTSTVKNDNAYSDKCKCLKYEPCLCKEREKTFINRSVSNLSSTLNNELNFCTNAKTQNNASEYNSKAREEYCTDTLECDGLISGEKHNTIQKNTFTETNHNTGERCKCKDISYKKNPSSYDNCEKPDLIDKDRNKAVLFCSVESKNCFAKSKAENMTEVQTEGKTTAWKQRYVVLKPKAKSLLSCNRNTCLPLSNSNNEKKILVQVPNTVSRENASFNEKNRMPEIDGKQCTKCEAEEKYGEINENQCTICEAEEKYDKIVENQCTICEAEDKYDEIVGKQCTICEAEEKYDEIVQTKEESDDATSDIQKGSDEMSQTLQEKEGSKTSDIQVKNDDVCGNKQRYKKLCRTAIKRYEISGKTQPRIDCPWARVKSKIKCKTPEKYSELCRTQRESDEKCKKRGKKNDNFSELEDCLEECFGKKKNKCDCSL